MSGYSGHMTDDDWKRMIKRAEDPEHLLRELVQLDDDVQGVGDPYYADLYQTVIDRAREVLERG